MADKSVCPTGLLRLQNLDLCLADHLGHRQKAAIGVDLPAKAAACVFHSSLLPEESFEMRVTVTRIGNSSFTNEIEGAKLSGQPIFTAHLTPICVLPAGANASDRKSTPIPDALRLGLQRYLKPDALT